MPGIEPKKAALLRTLDILREHSDAEHWLEQDDIVYILEAEYGITLERKAVSRNIDTLIEMGYDIKKTRRGCYLVSREFEDSELRLLIDSVLSSRLISPKQSKVLIEKLKGLSSKYFSPRVKHIHTLDEWNKNENPALFYNIDIIDEAIEKKRKLRFMMNEYGIDKKLHPTREHIVSPYRLFMKDQNYYMLCLERRDEVEPKYYNLEPAVSLFQLGRISDLKILQQKADRHNIEAASYEEIFREYGLDLFNYLYEKAEPITFVCHEREIERALSAFGKNIRIEKLPEIDFDANKLHIIGSLRRNFGKRLVKITVRTTQLEARRFVEGESFATIISPHELKKSIDWRNSEEMRREYLEGEKAFYEPVEKAFQKAEEKR